jgi:hypothetical protein
MIRYFFVIGLAVCLANSASAQQTRAKLDAPGKVAFGSSYEHGKTLLGTDAEAYEPDPPELGMKVLSCEKCAPLPNVEGFTMYFQDKGGLIRLEAFAIAGMFKAIDACQKADTDMLPKLVAQYGKPDSSADTKKGPVIDRIVTFKFADGAIIQHKTHIFGADRPCLLHRYLQNQIDSDVDTKRKTANVL